MGTAVPDTAASYTPPPTHFNRKPERKAYTRTTARGGSKGRGSGYGCARHGIIHSTERGGVSGHGCARHRGIIHTNDSGGVGSGYGCARYRGIIPSTPKLLQS